MNRLKPNSKKGASVTQWRADLAAFAENIQAEPLTPPVHENVSPRWRIHSGNIALPSKEELIWELRFLAPDKLPNYGLTVPRGKVRLRLEAPLPPPFYVEFRAKEEELSRWRGVPSLCAGAGERDD